MKLLKAAIPCQEGCLRVDGYENGLPRFFTGSYKTGL